MNIILIYDVTDNKCNKIKKECNKYLNHVQNSVFEGDLTLAKITKLKNKLKTMINSEKDSVIIFSINNPKWINREVVGIEKNIISNFI